jgi:hypothetical protein
VHTRLLPALLVISALFPLTGHAIDTPIEGGPGSGTFRDVCPTGQFLVGVSIRSGTWVDAIYPLWPRSRLTAGSEDGRAGHGTVGVGALLC